MMELTAESFARDFRVLREIGRGRFGEASSVEHVTTGEVYALKRTRFGMKGQPDSKKVQIEADALARLQHPNVIRYHATFAEQGAVCILMEYASGGDLGTVLSRRWQAAEAEGQNTLPEDELMEWFVQLAEGLAHVHSMRVLHRDLKPENIFVGADGEAKIGDFGISRILQARAMAASVLPSAAESTRRVVAHYSPPVRSCVVAGHRGAGAHYGGLSVLPVARDCAGRILLVQERRLVARRHPLPYGDEQVPV